MYLFSIILNIVLNLYFLSLACVAFALCTVLTVSYSIYFLSFDLIWWLQGTTGTRVRERSLISELVLILTVRCEISPIVSITSRLIGMFSFQALSPCHIQPYHPESFLSKILLPPPHRLLGFLTEVLLNVVVASRTKLLFELTQQRWRIITGKWRHETNWLSLRVEKWLFR